MSRGFLVNLTRAYLYYSRYRLTHLVYYYDKCIEEALQGMSVICKKRFPQSCASDIRNDTLAELLSRFKSLKCQATSVTAFSSYIYESCQYFYRLYYYRYQSTNVCLYASQYKTTYRDRYKNHQDIDNIDFLAAYRQMIYKQAVAYLQKRIFDTRLLAIYKAVINNLLDGVQLGYSNKLFLFTTQNPDNIKDICAVILRNCVFQLRLQYGEFYRDSGHYQILMKELAGICQIPS